ncbi:GreA/GreB family elongation factor [Mangrovimonas aestuarii]|uniref:3-oxoacyl-ACP synthase n=1 Tax=Mangrovimonas aestuarii TaxID=3018443 RepID=UPI0029E7FCED|nr:3-oxoacyl-ACP synthase [Mangrovimonas aestuarii]
MDISVKQELYDQCKNKVQERLNSVLRTISGLEESLQSETKSSAGDKHETGRAMVQLEREKAGVQLSEIQKLQEVLSKIDTSKTTQAICLGSVVVTNKANYFVAVSSGELYVGGKTFYAISPNSPIGQLLLSKSVGDSVAFRGESMEVLSLL